MIIMNQAAGEEEARPTVGYRQDVPRIPSRDFFILSRVSYYRWLENHLDDNRGLEGHSDNNPGFPFRDCLEYHSDNKLGVPFTDVLENYLDDNIGAPFANVLENQSELGSSRVPEIFLESVRLSQRHSWKLTKLAVDVGVEDCIKRNIFKALSLFCVISIFTCAVVKPASSSLSSSCWTRYSFPPSKATASTARLRSASGCWG